MRQEGFRWGKFVSVMKSQANIGGNEELFPETISPARCSASIPELPHRLIAVSLRHKIFKHGCI